MDMTYEIMSQPKANQPPVIRIPVERIRKYAPGTEEHHLEDFVVKACEYYGKYLQRRQERDR